MLTTSTTKNLLGLRSGKDTTMDMGTMTVFFVKDLSSGASSNSAVFDPDGSRELVITGCIIALLEGHHRWNTYYMSMEDG